MITFEPFLFMPGMTINAVIRSKNAYVTGEKLDELVKLFNEANDFKIPRVGQNFKIPVDSDL